MRSPAWRFLLSELTREVASHANGPSATAFGDARTAALRAARISHSALSPWLQTWLRTPLHSTQPTPLPATRPFCSQATPPDNSASSSPSPSKPASASTSASTSAHTGRQLTRAKAPRHHPRAAPPSPPGGPKDKAQKLHGAKAASAATASKPSGAGGPLSPEVRQQLDALLAHMPYRLTAGGSGAEGLADGTAAAAAAGFSGRGAATVRVTGFYIGQPIPQATSDILRRRLTSHPLGPHLVPAGSVIGPDFALLLMEHNHQQQQVQQQQQIQCQQGQQQLSHQQQQHQQGQQRPSTPYTDGTEPGAEGVVTASTACHGQQTVAGSGGIKEEGVGGPEGRRRGEAGEAAPRTHSADVQVAGGHKPLETPGGRQLAALMLLEYGGVVGFNLGERPLLAALAEVAAAVLTPAQRDKLPYPAPYPAAEVEATTKGSRGPSGGRSGGDLEAWRRAAAEQLHREEQLLVVDPGTGEGGGKGKGAVPHWIRKSVDALHIWDWDSTNLESAARVVSQSAAIRYYNQQCDDMLRSYSQIKLHDDDSSPRWRAALAPWRSGLPVRQLRRMVFQSTGIRMRLYAGLGLGSPPALTWESGRHHAVWVGLRREFELDERREGLMEKTELLKQSCLDLISAHNETFTKRSELTIILLIAGEIVISLWDLHGTGLEWWRAVLGAVGA